MLQKAFLISYCVGFKVDLIMTWPFVQQYNDPEKIPLRNNNAHNTVSLS